MITKRIRDESTTVPAGSSLLYDGREPNTNSNMVENLVTLKNSLHLRILTRHEEIDLQ
jgi:hypothetical protein